MKSKIMTFFTAVALMIGAISVPAFADKPEDWGIYLQDAASPAAERIHEFHYMMMYIITGIVLFVLALLLYVVFRFRARPGVKPSMVTHNVMLEVLWTVIPVVILIVIAIPSFKLLYYVDRTETPDMTLKVTGYQWYWGYEYPDHQGINFTSYMVPEKDLAAGQVRLLSTDNPIVLPVNKNVQILVTAADVLHSWTVPSLGAKMDAVPGRLNETWVRINEPGTYFGQCSELCGKDHAYMPIEIKAVTQAEFDAWVAEKAGPAPAPAEEKESSNDTKNTNNQAANQLAAKATEGQ
jgi:cytochrome c oxidase subunit 2